MASGIFAFAHGATDEGVALVSVQICSVSAPSPDISFRSSFEYACTMHIASLEVVFCTQFDSSHQPTDHSRLQCQRRSNRYNHLSLPAATRPAFRQAHCVVVELTISLPLPSSVSSAASSAHAGFTAPFNRSSSQGGGRVWVSWNTRVKLTPDARRAFSWIVE